MACRVDLCPDPPVAKELCGRHYQRWRKHGDPLKVLPNPGNRTHRPRPDFITCKTCQQEKPNSAFPPRRRQCTACASEYKRRWSEANPEKVAVYVANGEPRRLRYELERRAVRNGLDPVEVLAYYDAHDGRCEICGQVPRPGGRDLNMDHDHASGDFRGMLCDNCNSGLGRFKDDVTRLESAINYLKRHHKPAPPAVDGA